MHRQGGVAEHRLGPRGRNRHAFVRAGDRIIDFVQLAVLLAELDLDVGDRGAAVRAPVDHSQIAIDQAVTIELDENAAHGARQAFVQREARAGPVSGCAEAFELIDDLVAVLFLPLPHFLDELFASEVEARDALRGESAVDHHLRADAGVIRPRQPQRVESAHALPADDDVVERVYQCVADVEAAGDVRRRDDDRELRPLAIEKGSEEFSFLPRGVDPLFEAGRVVAFGEFLFHETSAGL